MKDAYADGDDEAGDAAFDALYAEDGSLLEESGDFDPEDDWMLEFSFAGENAKGADREALERRIPIRNPRDLQQAMEDYLS